MSGDDDIVQHIIPNNKLLPQESKGGITFSNNYMSSYMHRREAENQIQIKYGDTSAQSERYWFHMTLHT